MQLERVLKQRHAIALAFGAMVGWSWVLLTGEWIERAGSAGALLAFLLAGGALVLIALTYAELAAAMPQVGGEHVYTERAFGRGVSFVCSWALLLGYVSVVAFEVVAFPYALSELVPAISVGRLWRIAGWDVYAGQVAVGLAGALAVTALNVRGLSLAAGVQAGVTALIVVAGLWLVSGAAGAGEPANLLPLFESAGGVLAVVVMVPLLFVGFDVIPQAAEEIDLPPRRIGLLVVASVICGMAFYMLVIAAVAWILAPDARAAAGMATAEAAARAWG
ncbi:MAG: APC family permease, partial [Gammaproteobacteria bacterium]